MKVEVKKNTDQLNYEDFLGGITRDVTIVKVGKGRKEAQYDIAIEGDDRYWRPPATVLKLLVLAYGNEAANWVGKRARLYGDPSVKMKGVVVGGIRVSHLSHIEKPIVASLAVTRGQTGTFTIDPLPDAPAPRDWDAVVATAQGLTDEADLRDLWTRESVGSAPADVQDAIKPRVAETKAAEITAEDAFIETSEAGQ